MPDRPRYDGYLSESSFNEFESPDITAWKLARAAVEHENALVNHRITWLLQSQAFLFSAFFLVFLSWSRGDVYGAALTVIPGLLAVIALFGIYVCIVIQRGIARANEALSDVTVHYKALAEKNGFRRTPPLHKWKRPMLLCDQQDLPMAAAVLWAVVLVGLLGTVFPRS